jgi:hypothetical protein
MVLWITLNFKLLWVFPLLLLGINLGLEIVVSFAIMLWARLGFKKFVSFPIMLWAQLGFNIVVSFPIMLWAQLGFNIVVSFPIILWPHLGFKIVMSFPIMLLPCSPTCSLIQFVPICWCVKAIPSCKQRCMCVWTQKSLTSLHQSWDPKSISTGAQYVTLDNKIKCLSIAVFLFLATPPIKL